jgi:hypothetical protein
LRPNIVNYGHRGAFQNPHYDFLEARAEVRVEVHTYKNSSSSGEGLGKGDTHDPITLFSTYFEIILNRSSGSYPLIGSRSD